MASGEGEPAPLAVDPDYDDRDFGTGPAFADGLPDQPFDSVGDFEEFQELGVIATRPERHLGRYS